MGHKTTPNWDRWHNLQDILQDILRGDERVLTPSEENEYLRLARIVALLDAEAARAANITLDGLVKEHERVIASIRRLTAAINDECKKSQ